MKYPFLTLLVIHLCVISLTAIIVTAADKIKAKRGKWRVPEAVLLTISALGGSFVMYLIMKLIRHKTKHKKFMIGIPIMMLFHLILFLWILRLHGIL